MVENPEDNFFIVKAHIEVIFSDSWLYRSFMDNLSQTDTCHVCSYTCDNRGWKSDGVGSQENVSGCSSTGKYKRFTVMILSFWT